MDMEIITAELIVHSGDARSKAMEAIALAKTGTIDEARAKLKEADRALTGAHKAQAAVIQEEAEGRTAAVSVLLVHAQDHLMNAITVKDLAYELIDLYELIFKGAKK